MKRAGCECAELDERVKTTFTRAIWNGAVIASTDMYELGDGNVYFPPSSVDMQYLIPNETHTTCAACHHRDGWKGQALYYTVVVDGKENKDAPWFYLSPKPTANRIMDYVAFWKGVQAEKAATALETTELADCQFEEKVSASRSAE